MFYPSQYVGMVGSDGGRGVRQRIQYWRRQRWARKELGAICGARVRELCLLDSNWLFWGRCGEYHLPISILWQAITSSEDFEIDPSISGMFSEVLFINELLWGILDLDVYIFSTIHGRLQVDFFMSKVMNLACRRDKMLLVIILMSSKEPVGVPTSPGYQMPFPPMVMRVWCVSALWGRTSQTTFV